MREATKKAQKKEQAAGRLNGTEATVDMKTDPQPGPVVQDYVPNPAIWKLSDADTTIYMFGTFHILPEGFRWRSDAFNAIVNEVDELVVETSDDDSDAEIEALVTELVVQSMNPDRVTVSERLSANNREKWFSIADSTGMPREFFDRMPLIFSMLGAGLDLAEQQGSQSEYGVETILEAEFKAAGKLIGSIEDSGEVMQALLGIDEGLALEDLDAELTKWDGKALDTLFTNTAADLPNDDAANGATDDTALVLSDKNDKFETEHAWAQGIEDRLGIEEFGDTEFGRQMYKVLLIDRNRAWAKWLENRLDQPGTVLLAVGAGHFEGKDSVQIMLSERGLTAERLH